VAGPTVDDDTKVGSIADSSGGRGPVMVKGEGKKKSTYKYGSREPIIDRIEHEEMGGIELNKNFTFQ
jgi:hypothetical protein